MNRHQQAWQVIFRWSMEGRAQLPIGCGDAMLMSRVHCGQGCTITGNVTTVFPLGARDLRCACFLLEFVA